MATKMDGIFQPSLFSQGTLISVALSESSRYRVLANILPWPEMAEVANKYRGQKVSLTNGRALDLRLHLGAFVAQHMNGWTDRETEEMVRLHAGVRFLCALEESLEDIDRTSIEKFRNMIGQEGVEELNQLIVRFAVGAGFTGSELCSSDTTVQEAPIEHPTEVSHMKKISEKLSGIGKKIGGKVANMAKEAAKAIQDTYTEIRLFARGKTEKAIEKKKSLSLKMHRATKDLLNLIFQNLEDLTKKAKTKAQNELDLYSHMLQQIIQWLKTGEHPHNKLISLWNLDARAITRNKASKTVEFGRRWIVTRLHGGYVIGAPCVKLGGDSDKRIANEVLCNFLDTLGEVPTTFVYDRGGDGPKNHETLRAFGVESNCIFPNGAGAKMDVTEDIFDTARRERALSEASIATIKHNKYGFNKPRARSSEGCTLKGHAAFLGANFNRLIADTHNLWKIAPEIT